MISRTLWTYQSPGKPGIGHKECINQDLIAMALTPSFQSTLTKHYFVEESRPLANIKDTSRQRLNVKVLDNPAPFNAAKASVATLLDVKVLNDPALFNAPYHFDTSSM
jgi:hypothetical protein